MGRRTPLPHRRLSGFFGSALGAVLTFSLAAPALALEEPSPDPAEQTTRTSAAASANTNEPSFTPDLQTEISIGENTRPSDFAVSSDGSLGYVTAAELPEFMIIDMHSHEIITRIPFAGQGGDRIRISADGTRAYFGVYHNAFIRTVGIVDLTTQTLVEVLPPPGEIISQLALSQDGQSLYTLGLQGMVRHLDARTGEELASKKLTTESYHGLLLVDNDTQLLVGQGNTVFTLDAITLAENQPAFTLPGVSQLAHMTKDQSDTRIYFADGGSVGLLDPSTQAVQRVGVGEILVGTAGVDSSDRAFTASRGWEMIMAADFTTGKRSESFRRTPTAANSVRTNPATGDLLVAVGGWSNSTKGSTVSIMHAPRVTDPQNVRVSIGETARFESEAIGIQRGNGGGIIWQSSPDGTTWTDIAGAVNEQLDVVASAETLGLQYRLRWADDFWGQRGASAPAKMVLAQAPKILYSDPFPEGKVGEDYPATVITAEGAADLLWSIDEQHGGLPAGMTLNPENGTLQGTPERAGTYEFTVIVTDAFGTDSRKFELTVTAAAGGVVTPPAPPETETAGSDSPAPGPQPGDEKILSSTGGASPAYLWALALACVGAGILLVRSVPKR